MKLSKSTSLSELAGFITNHLQQKGIQTTLVGGAVVTIYSDNEYQSRDLDFISPSDNKEITEAMAEIGFVRKGKDFYHVDTDFTVEFPTGPIAIGNDIPVKPDGQIKTKSGFIRLLSPTQCIMDRLAWFYHYNDRQCLDQALAVAKNHKINFSKIKIWSEKENALDKYELFLTKLKSK